MKKTTATMKLKTFQTKNLILFIVAAILYTAVYFAMSNDMMTRSWQSLILKMGYNIVLAISLNLVVGFLGELSLGHAAFYAVGAYSGCLAATMVPFPVWGQFFVGVAVGGTVAAIVGFLISSSILRLRGDYLAIVTLAFGEMIRSFVKIIPGLGGTQGLTGIPSFTDKPTAFLFFFAMVLITLLVITNLVNSRHGRAIQAIRDNAIAAESVGINVKRYKVMAFVVAAFFAGIAGVMFGFFKTSVTPGDFTYNVSIEVLVMVVLGGMGNVYGSVIAACIITALPEVLRGADQYRLLIYAVALILMMLFNSNPKIIQMKEKLFGSRKKTVTEEVVG